MANFKKYIGPKSPSDYIGLLKKTSFMMDNMYGDEDFVFKMQRSFSDGSFSIKRVLDTDIIRTEKSENETMILMGKGDGTWVFFNICGEYLFELDTDIVGVLTSLDPYTFNLFRYSYPVEGVYTNTFYIKLSYNGGLIFWTEFETKMTNGITPGGWTYTDIDKYASAVGRQVGEHNYDILVKYVNSYYDGYEGSSMANVDWKEYLYFYKDYEYIGSFYVEKTEFHYTDIDAIAMTDDWVFVHVWDWDLVFIDPTRKYFGLILDFDTMYHAIVKLSLEGEVIEMSDWQKYEKWGSLYDTSGRLFADKDDVIYFPSLGHDGYHWSTDLDFRQKFPVNYGTYANHFYKGCGLVEKQCYIFNTPFSFDNNNHIVTPYYLVEGDEQYDELTGVPCNYPYFLSSAGVGVIKEPFI